MSDAMPGDNVLFRFFRTGQTLRQLFVRAVEGTGLSGDEYGVLSGVGVLGPISPSELAARLGMPPTTMSVYVARFVERGLVRRLPNPRDGRSYLLESTEEGRRLQRTIAPRVRGLVELLAGRSDVPLDELEEALAALDAAAKKALDARTTNV